MPSYIVNSRKTDGRYHEVHVENSHCNSYPSVTNTVLLGFQVNCQSALSAANSKGYRPADGCKFCVPECHKR